jgi:hypothetical protein
MQTEEKTDATLNISREKFVSFVSQMFGGSSGYEDPDHPLKPGPWDPVIRKALERIQIFFGPRPEPWRSVFGPDPIPWRSEFNVNRAIFELIAARDPRIWDVIGGGHNYSKAAAELNPQPLPPRAILAFAAAFAQEAVDRMVLMQEIADAMPRQGEQQGIIIVSGRLALLVDELCGNNFKIKIPIPRPKHDTDDKLSGLELIVMGAVFEQKASTVTSEGLQQELSNVGAKLIETGIARM